MRASWEALHASLSRSIHTLQADQSFLAAKQQHPALAGFGNPSAVVAYLTGKQGDRDVKDHLLATLVTIAQRARQGLASALLWLGLWPGLDAAYRRRIKHFIHQPEELVSEFGDAFSALIERIDLRSVTRVAATLVMSTERDVMDGRKRVWVQADRAPRSTGDRPLVKPARGHDTNQVAVDQGADQRGASIFGIHPGLSFDHDVATLHARLALVVGRDADLLIGVLVFEENQREAGERLGLSHEAARKRVQRARARVRAHFETRCPTSPAEPAFST